MRRAGSAMVTTCRTTTPHGSATRFLAILAAALAVALLPYEVMIYKNFVGLKHAIRHASKSDPERR